MKKIKVKIQVFKKFISEEDICELNTWILNEKNLTFWNQGYFIAGYRFFDPNNKSWEKDEYNRILLPISKLNNKFLNLRDQISKIIKIEQELKSKNATSLISVIKKNGFVASHKDSTIDGHVHVRANIAINTPKSGSCVVIENKKYEINAGDLIVFPANILEHSTTIHQCDEPRTIISYPFLIPQNIYET
jgi:hypothetical protein